MSETIHQKNPPSRERSVLKVVYWVLGSLSFLQILLVGIALTLTLSQKNTPAPVQSSSKPTQSNANSSAGQKTQAAPGLQQVGKFAEPLRPRTLEEMLNEPNFAQLQNPAPTAPPTPAEPAPVPPLSSPSPEEQNPVENELLLNPKLAELLKQSRYHQIEGDMKRSILKLEEAAAIDGNHPVVLYYFGLAYEAIRNAAKSREYFVKVVTMREKAGKYFPLAAKHLETGFSTPADKRGDMAFGTIMEYREPDSGDGERVVLTIPILMKDNLHIRPEDLYIPIQFFDIANNKKIEPTRAEEAQVRWTSEPVDWSDGEETLEVRYHMPPMTQEELTAYGDLKYYGFTAKLYYKGEPMDCHASPDVLFLIEQMNQSRKNNNNLEYLDYGDPGVLPPIEAEPAYKSNIMGDSSLLPP